MDTQTQTQTHPYLNEAYHNMLDADEQHAAFPTEGTRTRVLSTQQTYYARLTTYYKQTYAHDPLTLQRLRARTLWQRAIQNKRTALTPDQLDTATHQIERALAILRRVNNTLTLQKEQQQTTRANTREQKALALVTTTHPITRRRVRVTQQQKDEWKATYG